jgi:hypothetical protein
MKTLTGFRPRKFALDQGEIVTLVSRERRRLGVARGLCPPTVEEMRPDPLGALSGPFHGGF